jgi:hypothetical protein
MLSLECNPPTEGEPCACCGGRTTSLVRYVRKDGFAHAIYIARYSDNHPDREVGAVVMLGPWGEGTSAQDRSAFLLRIREKAGRFQVMVDDANMAGVDVSGMASHRLTREQALAHPMVREVFAVSDLIVAQDANVIEYFIASR